jgi:predicted TIM-barrel fold metal-dependent hydrolase
MLMRKIIDFHTHPFYKYSENTCMYKENLSFEQDFFKKDLEEAGISHICGSVIEPNTYRLEDGFEPFRLLNREALQKNQQWQGYYTPGIHVHPAFVKESCEELIYMHSNGVKLIGELVPYMHGWSDYSCKDLSEILEVAEGLEMVVSFHSMDNDQMEKMIASHPNITFVAAHPGEKNNYLLHIERMKKYKNAFLDLSGTGLFRYGMLKYGVEKVGSDRFLFGTDYPICNPSMYIHAVEFEHISDNAKEAIFHQNAERLLGI